MSTKQGLYRIDCNIGGPPNGVAVAVPKPMTVYPTSSARFCILVRDAISERGYDPAHVLAATEIAPSALYNPSNKIPLHKVVKFWERAAEATQDPYFGLHVGQATDVKSLGALGRLLLYSSTVEMALKNFERFVSVNQDSTESSIQYGAKTFSITYAINDSAIWPRRHEVEASLALRLNLIRTGTSRKVETTAAHFEHDAPSDLRPLKALFGDNLHFNAGVNKLTFERSVLREKLIRTDTDMLGIIEEHISRRLSESEAHLTFSEALEIEIRDAIAGGYLSSEAVAEKLAISSRTMRRRLHKERGISFQEFVKRIRIDLASSYLRDERLTIGEISFLLGYSEESAFCRAFRQWSNMTPMEFRHKKRPFRPSINPNRHASVFFSTA